MRLLLLFFSFWLFSTSAMAEDEEKEAPAVEYLRLAPKLTVNLAERRTYLMLEIELLIEGLENRERINSHIPALRHELIIFLSGKNEASLKTMNQREAVRKESLSIIRSTLDKYSKSDGLLDLFFTAFLVN